MMKSWHYEVAYQVYPKSFNDTKGDGSGDIPGVIEKLDYIKDLGIDVIWLSPVYRSPMKDNGYDISDYQDIDPSFGTMDDMRQLISKAKKRNIRIIMDLVINHSSDQHPWFLASASSKDDPKRDWYIWEEADEEGNPPNNLRTNFGGSCWTWHVGSQAYYFHSFTKEQPDLNWDNKDMREALYTMINWWIDQGIGGFRVDAITFIKKQFPWKQEPADSPDGTAKVQPNQPGIGKFLQEMKERCFTGKDIFTVAEAPGVPFSQYDEYAGVDGYFDMLIGFEHIDVDVNDNGRWYPSKDWHLSDYTKPLTEEQKAISEGGWTALYIENHDQPRSLSRFIPEAHQTDYSAKAVAVSYFFLKGMPYVYQGQEIGMTNVNWEDINQYDDIWTIDEYHTALREGFSHQTAIEAVKRRSRDHARTPMHWDDSLHAGFTSGTPWLPVNDNYQSVNAKQAQADDSSIRNFFKKMISLRKSDTYRETIAYGSYTHLVPDHDTVYVYTRSLKDQTVLVAVNFSATPQKLSQIQFKLNQHLFGNADHAWTKEVLNLDPFEAVVLDVTRLQSEY